MPALLDDIQLLARLVGHDSTSHLSNRAIADFVCDYLDGGAQSICRNESADGSKTNLVISFGPPPEDHRGLTLCGHLDVVPADEPGWQSGAFSLDERDGRLYGRGSCDMKGFIALAMNIARAGPANELTAPLVLLLTYDEELGSLGAQRMAATWPVTHPLPRSVVIGEPTSLRVVRMHKGHLKMRAVVHGRAAHSGSPHLGRNAIEPAGAVIAALGALRRELQAERVESSRWFDAVPFAVLNVARIRGGEAINVVPSECVIDVGVRLLPGMDGPEMIARIERAIDAAAIDLPVEVQVVNDNPPMLLDAEADVCRALCEVTGEHETIGVSFASDAGVLRRDLGMECVLYGPGSIEVAHQPNEFVPIDEMQRARRDLETLVRRVCTGDQRRS